MKRIITTPRLFLRQFNEGDAPFLLELLNSPGWIENIGDRNIKTLHAAEQYLEENYLGSYEKQGFGFYVIERKTDEKPLGMCGLIKREELEDVDIGFALLPQFVKKGYGFEAASATIKYAQEELNLSKIVAITIAKNKNSQHLLEKIGLSFEKMIPFKGETLMLFSTEK